MMQISKDLAYAIRKSQCREALRRRSFSQRCVGRSWIRALSATNRKMRQMQRGKRTPSENYLLKRGKPHLVRTKGWLKSLKCVWLCMCSLFSRRNYLNGKVTPLRQFVCVAEAFRYGCERQAIVVLDDLCRKGARERYFQYTKIYTKYSS